MSTDSYGYPGLRLATSRRRGRWIAISRNKRISYNPVENRLLHRHGVRAIFLTGRAEMTSWDRLVLIVRHWDAIEARLEEHGPWTKALTRTGLSELKMTGART